MYLAILIRSGQRTRLDLSCVKTDYDICDRCIFRFTASVRNDRSVSGFLSHFDRIESFRQGSDLVYLDQNGVCDALFDTLCQSLVYLSRTDRLLPAGLLPPSLSVRIFQPSQSSSASPSSMEITGYLSQSIS